MIFFSPKIIPWCDLSVLFLLYVYFSNQHLIFLKPKLFTWLKIKVYKKKVWKSLWKIFHIDLPCPVLAFLTTHMGTHKAPEELATVTRVLCLSPVLCMLRQIQMIYSCSCFCAQMLAYCTPFSLHLAFFSPNSVSWVSLSLKSLFFFFFLAAV